MVLLVRCPACHKQMKCAPRVPVSKAVKVCVYCGRSFKIHKNLLNSSIIGTT